MSSISERLKALGVQFGAQNILPPRKQDTHSIEQVVPGRVIEDLYGETYIVENIYPNNYRHGAIDLIITPPPEIVAAWVGEPSIVKNKIEDIVFLDTETTGLSGSAGIYAFLIGVGRFDGNVFRLAQFFLRQPGEELAHLAAMLEFIGDCRTLVTFNGKSFDIPILTTRFLLQGMGTPFKGIANLDLLQLARRLWRERLPSRTLLNLETQILGFSRTEEDVPSWVIPQLYVDYLRTDDARLIKNVFYHNAKDILSMVTLYNHITSLLTLDLSEGFPNTDDLIGVGRIYESIGHLEEAARIYQQSLKSRLPKSIYLQILEKLSSLYKRHGDWANALQLWKLAAQEGEIYANIELAKYYEHRAHDYTIALKLTQAALGHLLNQDHLFQTDFDKRDSLEHRLERLKRKLG
jgi:uncharacterized protein YprB with RNaseH-like and TPR domain